MKGNQLYYSSQESLLAAGNRSADYVCLHMFYDVGMKDDGDMPGLAHLSEHMIETQSVNDGTFYYVTNAFLSMEYTCFYARGLIEDAYKIFTSQSDLPAKAIESADEKLFENEKRRILLENKAAKGNLRRKNVLLLQEKVFGSGFASQIDIPPAAFLKISLKEVKQFIESKYCQRPLAVYSGGIGDIVHDPLQENRKPVLKRLYGEGKEKIRNGLYQHDRFFCIALEPIEGAVTYFQFTVLLELYHLIWNLHNDEKIISTAIKLFDKKTLLIFECNVEAADWTDNFDKMKEDDFLSQFRSVVRKVELNTLYRLHDLAAYNVFLYKAYRYLNEIGIDFDTIKHIFFNLNVNDILTIHKRIVRDMMDAVE